MHSFQVQTHISTENSKSHKYDQSMNKQEEITLSTTHNSIVDPPYKGSLFIFSLNQGIHSKYMQGKE